MHETDYSFGTTFRATHLNETDFRIDQYWDVSLVVLIGDTSGGQIGLEFERSLQL